MWIVSFSFLIWSTKWGHNEEAMNGGELASASLFPNLAQNIEIQPNDSGCPSA